MVVVVYYLGAVVEGYYEDGCVEEILCDGCGGVCEWESGVEDAAGEGKEDAHCGGALALTRRLV